MNRHQIRNNRNLHHRIGGLEKTQANSERSINLHHRIGGLEKLRAEAAAKYGLHHRIGGLENKDVGYE